jgi:hypothetical protein
MNEALITKGIRSLFLFLAPLALAAAVDHDASLSAVRKFQQIADGAYASGTSVELSQDEMNAFLRYHAAASIPEGIQDPNLEFREGGAILSAQIDLEKATVSSESLPALMRLLLRGTRRVVLDIDYAVSEGYAVARLVSMTIEEVELGGPVLEWFLDSFAPPQLRPYLIGEKATRQEGVRETRLEPGRAVIVVE